MQSLAAELLLTALAAQVQSSVNSPDWEQHLVYASMALSCWPLRKSWLPASLWASAELAALGGCRTGGSAVGAAFLRVSLGFRKPLSRPLPLDGLLLLAGLLLLGSGMGSSPLKESHLALLWSCVCMAAWFSLPLPLSLAGCGAGSGCSSSITVEPF